MLSGCVGRTFEAIVLDEGDGRDSGTVEIQIAEPPVIARVGAHNVDPGDVIRVRVAGVDVDARRVDLERVA